MTIRDMIRSPVQAVIRGVLRGWLGFSLQTTRWRLEATPEARALLLNEREGGGKTGLLVAFWHEELALSPALWWWTEPRNPSMRLHVLISRNRDGRLIADVVAPWRIPAIHGSSDSKGKNKGGAAALRRIRAVLREGHVVAVMPDGPKGPRRQVQQGVLALAEQVGAPIIPVGIMCRNIRAGSWDRMVLPLPFGVGKIVCGAPVSIRKGERDEARQRLTAGLNAASEAASAPAEGRGERLFPMSVGDGTAEKGRTACGSFLWAGLATLLAPGLTAMLRVRVRRGKEVRERLRERMGLSRAVRPAGVLVWLHAASVGETVSLLPVVRALLEDRPSLRILMTTGTVTAARTLMREFPREMASGRVVHQFVPLDVSRWVRRFLTHWRPACLVLTESELWPNMLSVCGSAGIPAVVVNGRLSPQALAGWRRVPGLARWVMSGLTWVAARSPEDAARFRVLGAAPVFCAGDLKMSAPPPVCDPVFLRRAEEAIGGRPVWIAAATHAGEEEAVFAAAKLLRARIPDLLTIVAPRHPDRGQDIARLACRTGLTADIAPRRAAGLWPRTSDAVWVVDTLGELGTLFRLSRVVFMGNSLLPANGPSKGGGHNPFEPARCGCVIATGPATGNFEEAFEALAGSVTVVRTPAELAAWAGEMLGDPVVAEERAAAGMAAATRDTALPRRLADRIGDLVSNG